MNDEIQQHTAEASSPSDAQRWGNDPWPADEQRASLPLPDNVVLVLQGGGALGSYQAGVYEALIDLGIELDWVAGISIGAVNAAIIVGNSRASAVARLRDFWTMVSSGTMAPGSGWDAWLAVTPFGDAMREASHVWAASQVMMAGVPGFFTPRFPPAALAMPGTPEAVSHYDTTPLIATLDRLVDWDRVNDGKVRLSVGAVAVESGNFRYFDTAHDRLDARHVLASGALPPGLPPVEIDGCWYWDGGLVSNTPLAHVVDDADTDMLVFQVDLFPARGTRPRDLEEAWSREKDIRYSSRTRQVSDVMLRRRREHQAMARLLEKLGPEDLRRPEAQAVDAMLQRHALNLVQLIHRPSAWQTGARDFEFSRSTMEHHWAMGRDAVRQSLREGRLVAESILGGNSAAFDLVTPPPLPQPNIEDIEQP